VVLQFDLQGLALARQALYHLSHSTSGSREQRIKVKKIFYIIPVSVILRKY
jgi:hypothetical protein